MDNEQYCKHDRLETGVQIGSEYPKKINCLDCSKVWVIRRTAKIYTEKEA